MRLEAYGRLRSWLRPKAGRSELRHENDHGSAKNYQDVGEKIGGGESLVAVQCPTTTERADDRTARKVAWETLKPLVHCSPPV
jgi:hypothetical protein